MIDFIRWKRFGALFWGWRDRWRMKGSLWEYRHWRYEGGKMLYIDRRPVLAWFGYPNSLIEDAFTQGTAPSGYLKDNLCWSWSSGIFAFLETVFLYLAFTKSPWPVNAQSTIFIWVKWKGEMFFCSGQSWRPGRIWILHLPWIYPHPAPGVFHFLKHRLFHQSHKLTPMMNKVAQSMTKKILHSPFPLRVQRGKEKRQELLHIGRIRSFPWDMTAFRRKFMIDQGQDLTSLAFHQDYHASSCFSSPNGSIRPLINHSDPSINQ